MGGDAAADVAGRGGAQTRVGTWIIKVNGYRHGICITTHYEYLATTFMLFNG